MVEISTAYLHINISILTKHYDKLLMCPPPNCYWIPNRNRGKRSMLFKYIRYPRKIWINYTSSCKYCTTYFICLKCYIYYSEKIYIFNINLLQCSLTIKNMYVTYPIKHSSLTSKSKSGCTRTLTQIVFWISFPHRLKTFCQPIVDNGGAGIANT